LFAHFESDHDFWPANGNPKESKINFQIADLSKIIQYSVPSQFHPRISLTNKNVSLKIVHLHILLLHLPCRKEKKQKRSMKMKRKINPMLNNGWLGSEDIYGRC